MDSVFKDAKKLLPAIIPHDAANGLPSDGVERAMQAAKMDGLFAGATAGLTGAFRMPRTQVIFSTLVTGTLAGYYFTQGFAAANLSQLRQALAASVEAPDESSNAKGRNS